MPRVPEELLRSVVYIFPTEEEAREGRGPGGTGFLLDKPGVTAQAGRWVVSNSHVVSRDNTYLRINTKDGGVHVLAMQQSDWVSHPEGDDVAIAPMISNIRSDWDVSAIPWSDVAPTPERMLKLNVGIGDEVIMLGRFFAHSGKLRNHPMARFGNIAMMPGELVKDGRGYLVDAYLVEMRSLPGFSGSPVFIYVGPGSYRGKGKMMPFYSETIGLLGIDTGHKNEKGRVIDETTGECVNADWMVQQNSGVAIVAPYTKIRDILESRGLTAKNPKAE